MKTTECKRNAATCIVDTHILLCCTQIQAYDMLDLLPDREIAINIMPPKN